MSTEKPTSPLSDEIQKGRKPPNEVKGHTLRPTLDSDRVKRIQEAAYHRAQERGFSPGAELDDWLAAERDIDQDR